MPKPYQALNSRSADEVRRVLRIRKWLRRQRYVSKGLSFKPTKGTRSCGTDTVSSDAYLSV